MYWIYLIIFILAVLTPEMIKKDIGTVGQERIEELIIFFLGIISFLAILIREKQLLKSQEEKNKIQRESHQIFKDLKNSYSYIGEINRKLDILKNIALGLPENSALTANKEKEIYDSIAIAIRTLGKTNNFSLRFVNAVSESIEREIRGSKSFYAKIKSSMLNPERDNCITEVGKYVLICSPRSIDNVNACIIIEKKRSQIEENIEIFKALASQALFLYAFSRKNIAPQKSY